MSSYNGNNNTRWKRAKVRVHAVIHPILTTAIRPVMAGLRKARKISIQSSSSRDWKFPEQDKGEFHLLRAMDGPLYRCDYLGFTAISKPPTGVNALQSHLKDLYLKYRRVGSGGRDASLKLVQQGIFITLLQDGQIADELFFSFDAVNFIEVVKFAVVKNSSEKKQKAIFIPVDETKGPVSDKHSFPLDKTTQFLTSLAHPPLVACVVRRPKGVKALDCHLFALESVENALHITSLVGSAQTPTGYDSKVGQGFVARGVGFESRGNNMDADPRGDGNFNRGVRGDVIRPDYSEYSFYRGQPNYETVQNNLPPSSSFDMGGSRLPPTNIQRKPSGDPPHVTGHGAGSEEAMVYGLYEQPRAGAVMAGPLPPRPHDAFDSNVIMRRKDNNGGSNRNTPGNRSLSTGSEHSTSAFHRLDDPRHHNSNQHRLSAGVIQDPTSSPRYHNNVNNIDHRYFPPPSHHNPHQQPQPQQHHHPSPHTKPPIASQPSPHHQENPDFGPVFSASNLENRERDHNAPAQEEQSPDHMAGGKPIAKVPPHLRGVKVLPTDFRLVKLKPMEKKSESLDSQDSVYDNNNDIMQKYKALQEHSWDGEETKVNGNTRTDNNNKRHGQDSSDSVMRQDRQNNKQDSARHQQHRFSAPVYADGVQWNPGGGHHPSPSAYTIGEVANEPQSTKDAEIASMFSNMAIRNGNARRPPSGIDFEDSLGYLP